MACTGHWQMIRHKYTEYCAKIIIFYIFIVNSRTPTDTAHTYVLVVDTQHILHTWHYFADSWFERQAYQLRVGLALKLHNLHFVLYFIFSSYKNGGVHILHIQILHICNIKTGGSIFKRGGAYAEGFFYILHILNIGHIQHIVRYHNILHIVHIVQIQHIQVN